MNQNNDTVIKHKTGLLELADQRRNVPRAYKLMGVSRETACDSCLPQEGGDL